MLTGRCGCEAIRYEVADEFVVAFNCHCANCRAMTGSAFLPWGATRWERGRSATGLAGKTAGPVDSRRYESPTRSRVAVAVVNALAA
jgi:hypothetical protein